MLVLAAATGGVLLSDMFDLRRSTAKLMDPDWGRTLWIEAAASGPTIGLNENRNQDT